jgi:hypothetical protein
MNAVSPNARQTTTSPERDPAGSPDPVSEALDHFRSVATMLEMVDRLPDLAEDIRDWRPRDPCRLFPGDATPLEPVARHALDAVVTGLAMLGLAGATLCENSQAQLAADEIGVCREIGAAMMSLLERAKALLQTDEADVIAQHAQRRRSFAYEDSPREDSPDGAASH